MDARGDPWCWHGRPGNMRGLPVMLVFISHSTDPKTPSDKEYLDALVEALPEPDFKVLLDRKSLEGGDDWSQEIDDSMDECHAAVILFSRRALSSDWVNKEAAILSRRRAREPEFLLLSVALEGVSGKEVRKKKRFAAMGIGKWEFVDSGTPKEVAERIAQRCRACAPAPSNTPMERLAIRLTDILGEARLGTLERAARELGDTTSGLRARQHHALARWFANALVTASLQELRRLMLALSNHLHAAQLQQLFKWIRCLWVDAEAAAKIPPVAASPSPRRAIGVNGKRLSTFIVPCYLERAYPEEPRHAFIPVDTATGQDAFGGIRAQVEKYLTDQGHELETLDQELSEMAIRYFVVLPPPLPEPDLLSRLQACFPHLTFMLGTGEAEHDDPLIQAHPQLLLLEPPLSPKHEQGAWRFQMELQAILKNVSEGLP